MEKRGVIDDATPAPERPGGVKAGEDGGANAAARLADAAEKAAGERPGVGREAAGRRAS